MTTIATTGFTSVLHPGDPPPPAPAPDRDCLRDLNLDQVIAILAKSRAQYDLASLFEAPPGDPEIVAYRQDVFRDLEQDATRLAVAALAADMEQVRRHLAVAETATYPIERQRWFLRAAEFYVDAVDRFAGLGPGLALTSAGLAAFREYLTGYAASPAFRALGAETRQIAADLGAVRYTVRIEDGRVTVRNLGREAEYGPRVAETFGKFRPEDGRDGGTDGGNEWSLRPPPPPSPWPPTLNHVQARVLDGVARLHPDVFDRLQAFQNRRPAFPDPGLVRFEREIQFYLAFLDLLRPIRQAGLPTCYPEFGPGKSVRARQAFDLMLARKHVAEGRPVTCNDWRLEGPERILVVSGPNQSGKTTLARAFGQVHHLAALGCPVPAREARLSGFDRVLTHFERQESLITQRGKLKDDLVRIKRILDQATPRSIVIVNEMFSSTTLEDQAFLSRQVMDHLHRRDVLALCVTFLSELASLGPHTVSMVSLVDPADPAVRTFRLERGPATGTAHALRLAEKYGVTFDRLRERIAP